jgi:hypothetical protein
MSERQPLSFSFSLAFFFLSVCALTDEALGHVSRQHHRIDGGLQRIMSAHVHTPMRSKKKKDACARARETMTRFWRR